MVWIGSALQLATKWGPGVLTAAKGLDEFNKRYPNAQGKAAEFARGLAASAQKAVSKRTPGGRIRDQITILRAGIDAMAQDRYAEPSFLAQTKVWHRQLGNLEAALSIAEAQPTKQKRLLIAALSERAETLSRTIIEETTATAELMVDASPDGWDGRTEAP